ncbi:MAG TPA: GNAT family N-acetyltransferase [Tepidisphaeraceae bacterium]|jgi:ribosomal protein S18 acetylase RimI-like enzyme
MILAAPGHNPSIAQITEFIQSAGQRRIDVSQMWVAESRGKLVWAVLPVLNPGKTLLLLAGSNIVDSVIPAATQLVSELCDYYRERDVHLAQVLFEPTHTQARLLFGDLGFIQVAELIYLQGYVPRVAKAPPLAEGMRFLPYSAENHALFAEGILSSYRESLDCPALSGLRDIEDIIAGHRATGEHLPEMWQLLVEDDRPLGVVLLSRIPHSDAVELVYLGLALEARGNGLGTLLMQRAMHLIVADQRRSLTLAVDSKNEPALRLYFRHGMQRIAARVAMIQDLRKLGR